MKYNELIAIEAKEARANMKFDIALSMMSDALQIDKELLVQALETGLDSLLELSGVFPEDGYCFRTNCDGSYGFYSIEPKPIKKRLMAYNATERKLDDLIIMGFADFRFKISYTPLGSGMLNVWISNPAIQDPTIGDAMKALQWHLDNSSDWHYFLEDVKVLKEDDNGIQNIIELITGS